MRLSPLLLLVFASGVVRAQPASTFTTTGNMTTPRFAATATLLLDGKVLIAGGGNLGRLSSAELYDPATGLFAPTGGMTTARTWLTAILLADGRVLILGGSPEQPHSVELYDPSTGAFTAAGDIGGTASSAALLQTGKVLIAAIPFAELYDPVTSTFAPTGAYASSLVTGPGGLLPGPPIATSLADGRVLITWNSTQTELYDPGTGAFSVTGTMTAHGAWADGYSATLLPNGKVLVAGGGDDDESLYASAELYDPQTTTFTATGHMAQPRGGHTATLLADGTVLIGGYGFSVGLYDPASGTFGPAGNLTTQRFEQTATLLNSGQVLIAGGTPTTQIKDVLASAEIYTPARLVAAAVLLSLSGNGTGQGAIQHAESYQVASADNPAVGGEALVIYCTGLADGSVIPPQVAIGGRMAEVLWFGNTPGYTGLNQINVRVPDGVAPGPAVPVRINYVGRSSNEVTIGVR